MLIAVMSMVENPEDKDKIEKLYIQYNRLMNTVIYKLIKKREDREDTLMLAWERIIRTVHKIKDIESYETRSFVILIAERAAIDMYRKLYVGRGHEVALEIFDSSTFYSSEDEGYENHGVYEAIDRLPKKLGEAIILHYVHGLTGKEMADALGIKETTAMKRVQRARECLRKELGDVLGS